MSITTITIHKIYDDNNDNKSLQITIQGDDNLSETKFSEWIDGKAIHNKYSKEKSSRLIVKILAANEHNDFDLESCASNINEVDKYLGAYSAHFGRETFDDNDHIKTTEQDSYANLAIGAGKQSLNQYYNTTNIETKNPLDQSLERIKENNARIMENIHMLNRTLNYTKKKEILDLMCPKPMQSYPCNTCGKCFVYETGLKRHQLMQHALSDIQPRWQIVWTCVQCFQVWPCQDQAFKHSSECCKSDNLDFIREIKTSSLIQCEFCEKVFTSIPRLLRHLQMHTTTTNYQCNACEKAFSSYKTAEQHWSGCLWLKFCYNFTLPKMLLCNACDRKFRNYDHLYNHRYKVDHFMPKAHSTKGNKNIIDFQVYQCEMCGECYPTVSQLKTHRRQNHTHDDIGMQRSIDSISYE